MKILMANICDRKKKLQRAILICQKSIREFKSVELEILLDIYLWHLFDTISGITWNSHKRVDKYR